MPTGEGAVEVNGSLYENLVSHYNLLGSGEHQLDRPLFYLLWWPAQRLGSQEVLSNDCSWIASTGQMPAEKWDEAEA